MPQKILILDDDPDFKSSLSEHLNIDEIKHASSSNIVEATHLLRMEKYDLLVADANIPGNDKLQFIEHVIEIYPYMPVILMTSTPKIETAMKSIQLHVFAYVVKSSVMDELLKVIKEGQFRSEVMLKTETIKNRLDDWKLSLDEFKAVHFKTQLAPSATENFISITYENIIKSLLDLLYLHYAVSKGSQITHPCYSLNCPRNVELHNAIQQTIVALEKTKNSFKSKELAKLRVDLQSLLAE